MINLLPTQKKHTLSAARNNSMLLAYNIWLLAGIGAVILAFIAVYAILGIGQKSAEDNIAANQAKLASYADVRKQGQEFSQNLSMAQKIFASQVDYSRILVQIGQTMPRGSSLQNVTLDSSTIGTSTELSVNVTSTKTALKVKDTLAKNTDLFSNVYLESITAQGEGKYSHLATISVTIKKEALTK